MLTDKHKQELIETIQEHYPTSSSVYSKKEYNEAMNELIEAINTILNQEAEERYKEAGEYVDKCTKDMKPVDPIKLVEIISGHNQ